MGEFCLSPGFDRFQKARAYRVNEVLLPLSNFYIGATRVLPYISLINRLMDKPFLLTYLSRGGGRGITPLLKSEPLIV